MGRITVVGSSREVRPGSGSQGFDPGAVIFADADGKLNQNSGQLFWDNTNNRLLVGSRGVDTGIGPLTVYHTSGTRALAINVNGQLQLSVTGSTGGILIGGDVHLYRSATDVLRIDDTLEVAVTTRAGNGSAAAPAYSFINDTDTGWFLSAADDTRLSVGGLEVIAAANVGGTRKLGFFGIAPVARPTVSAAITDNTGGTVGNAIGAAPTLYDSAFLNNTFATVLDRINSMRNALVNLGLVT